MQNKPKRQRQRGQTGSRSGRRTAPEPVVKRKSSNVTNLKDFFVKNKGVTVVFIVIGIGIGVGIGTALTLGDVNQNVIVTPADRVSVQVFNAGDLTNLTTKFSAIAYSIDPLKTINNATFTFYKSWMVGVNGSAANLSFAVADDEEYVVRLVTTEPGYGNHSDMSFIVNQNATYTVSVYKEPTVFNTMVYDAGFSSNITDDPSFTLMMNVPAVDEGFTALWQPQLHNRSVSWFHINVTFDSAITWDSLNITSRQNFSNDFVDWVKWPVLFNSNRSIVFMFPIVEGGSTYLYDFGVDTSAANIESITFQFGDIGVSSRTIRQLVL